MQRVKFAAKKGSFIRMAVIISLLPPVLLLIFKTAMVLEKPLAILILFLPFALFAWIYLDTSYVIADDAIFYRSGFLRGKINISQIKSIVKGYTAWSGVRPATATNGLLIVADGGNEIYVSPENQDDFISRIKQLNENVEVKTSKF
jgi:hypothetical protein